jgi:hypothetical protein
MTPEQFAYWLQGFAELQATAPTQDQWQSIREHLGTVFNKVTPPTKPPVITPSDPLGEIMKRRHEEARREAIMRPPFRPFDQLDPFGGLQITC